MRAIVRPDLGDGEPLDLALMRIAEANGISGPRCLISSLGLQNACRSRRSDLSALQRFIGFDPSELPIWESRGRWANPGRGLVNIGGLSVPFSAVGRPLGRICHRCVAEGVTFRPTWDVKAMVACNVHGCFLSDACPDCGRRIDWDRPRIDRCRCARRLDVPSAPAPSGACSLARRLADAALGIGPLELGEAGLLAWFAGVRSAAVFQNGATVDRPDVTSSWSILEPVADVLDRWPSRFSEWLMSQRSREARSGSIYEHLPVLEELRRTFGACRPVMEAAVDALNGGDDLPPPKRHSRFGHPSPLIVGASAVARLRGVAPATLMRHVQEGLLPGRVFDGGGRRYVALRRELTDAPPVPRSTTPMVGRELGVARRQVFDLKRAGLLGADGAAPDWGLGIETLLRPLATQGSLPPDGVTLADVPKLRGPGLVPAIRHVLDGSLAIFVLERGRRPVLSRFVVSRSGLLAAVASGQLSVREVAKALRVPIRLVPLLVDADCLEAHGDGKRRRVPPESLKRFQTCFATAGQLAREVGTNSRTVLARLREAGLHPVIPSDVERGISSVWRRKEAEEWAWVRTAEERGWSAVDAGRGAAM